MDTDRLNRWLTLGANLGVLTGIILIIIELNQNADLMRAQMVQSRADNLVSSYEIRMHSDYWPEISAKRRAAASADDWIGSLTPSEYERVRYLYLRELNDIRSQYYMYQEGLLPQEIWDEATRGQIVRMMRLERALKWGCNPDSEFNTVLNRIASEEGVPECNPNEIGSR